MSGDDKCSSCGENLAAQDCAFNKCGNCCNDIDCDRHGIGIQDIHERLRDNDPIVMEVTHVQHHFDEATEGDWGSIKSIAGSILAHVELEPDFVPNHIATIASNVLKERYSDPEDSDIEDMLNWYDESFDKRGKPIYDDD